ncbi:MAG TPA: PRC-barrel domain-containing protein [Aestuariivirga sp.]|jgi:PRC-barrel domain protein
MIRTISYVALALFMASVPASVLAQNAPAGDPATQPPAVVLPGATAAPDTVAKENPPAPVDGQIILQDKATFLASAIIGGNVYSPSNESVGDVNDLVIKPTGEIDAVVVGVGGFIGIGEKNVAIALDRFTIEPTEDLASTKLVLNATKEELEAAPAFKSAYVQKLDQEYERQTQLMTQPSNEPGQYPTVPAPQK